ncbi:MAG: hypothetical protein V4850_37255 [Myxococcota bacterium]
MLQAGERADSSTQGRKEGQTRGNAYVADWFTARDPLDRTDVAGNALSEPGETDPSTGSFDGPESTPAQGPMDSLARVRATEADPVLTLRPSTEAELVELLPATAVAPDATRVTKRYGSVEQPFAYPELALDALFIGGTPHAEDVQQGGLGTCYLLADLVSMASQDPAHIEGMISVQGGVAVVMFHRYDEASQTWVPVPVPITTTLARNKENSGTLLGAGFRVAKEPVSAAWYAEINPSQEELVIVRKGVHEAAMWVPLIEKAYARYSEMYGQYGGHPGHMNDEQAGGSGYDAAEGGWSSAAMRVLYGEGVVDQQVRIKDAEGTTVVGNNATRVAALLRISDPRTRTMGAASGMSDQLPERLAAILERVLANPDAVPPDALAICRSVLVVANVAAAGNAVPPAVLASHARALVDAVPADSGGELGRARDVCTVLMDLGATDGTAPRSIYANHAYSVAGAVLRGGRGQVLDLRPEDLRARIGEVDGLRSEVELRNPHRRNEPDMEGDGPADGVEDGTFRMPLDQFLTMFTQLDLGALQ